MRLRKTAAVLQAAVGLLVCVQIIDAQSPVSFQYVYDDLNQLIKVIDSTGVVIQYVYDSVGNILQVNRSTVQPGALSIFNITPSQVPVGGSFTLQGQGFSTPSATTVLINGAAVTVISATATTLVVQLPLNATSGLISVTVGNTTVTFNTSLTVLQVPVITAVAPFAALSGTSVASFHIVGVNLNASTFQFAMGITITSASIDPSGTSATLSLTIAANAFGRFALVATNSIGSSALFPVWGVNSLSVPGLAGDDPDGDGLANAFELLLGTDPLNADTDGDGYSDGVEVVSGSNPLNPACTPLNCRFSGTAAAVEFDAEPFAVLNLSPTASPTEADSRPFSVLNVLTGAVSKEANSVLFAVCNAPSPCPPGSSPSARAKPQSTSTVTASSGSSLRTSVVSPIERRAFGVLSVAPSNGSVSISPRSTLVLAFSAPIDPASINSQDFSLAAGDRLLDAELRSSTDFRIVMLRAALPPDTPIRVSVSGQVRDLWGRRLPAFESEFRTAGEAEGAVIAQSPPLGATSVDVGLSPIRLYLAKTIGANPVTNDLRVTQDGEPVDGALRIAEGGAVVEFAPYSPLRAGAVVRVSWSPAPNANGHSMPGYEGLFATVRAASDVTEALRTVPDSSVDTSLNPSIEVEYSHALDPATVGTDSVALRDSVTSRLIASRIRLRGDRVIRILPAEPLNPGSNYTFGVSGRVFDLSGRPITPFQQTFATGTENALELPRLLSATPADGATEVEATAEIRLLFDRPVNPLTLSAETIWLVQDGVREAVSIRLSKDSREVVLTPEVPFKDSGWVQITVSGVEDLSGNTAPYSIVRFQVRRTSKLLAKQVRGNTRNSFAGGLFSAERRFIGFLNGRK